MEGTGNFGGDSSWTFNNLTLGSGSDNATTSKTGTGNIEVKGALTVSSDHTLEASSQIWNLSGSGIPLVVNGILDAQTSLFKYTGSSNSNIAAVDYYRLELIPSSGSPVYIIQSGNLNCADYIYVGDSTNSVSVTAATQDPTLDIEGDFEIRSNATFTASDINQASVGGSWSNSGVFLHNSGSFLFDASSSGQTIDSGGDSFYNVELNNSSGGWTIQNSNLLTENDFALNSASSFTLDNGLTLEVRGEFVNLVGGASTTWSGTTLYLNKTGGGSYTVNTKSAGSDSYATLQIGADTDVRVWNSSALNYSVDSSGSLYSMDHNQSDGSVYIWGDYHISTGTDYWSYDKDFDGAVLSGGLERQCNVRFATTTFTTTTLESGGSLEIAGASDATTTMDLQGSTRLYAIKAIGGSLDADYFRIRNINSRGLDISGTTTVQDLSHGDMMLAVNGGSLITVTPSVIEQGNKTFTGNTFATSANATSGSNVYLTAQPSTSNYWRFQNHNGSFAGEDYDNDFGGNGGDPGYIRWDDSLSSIDISGTVYSDEGSTPMGSPTCDGQTEVVRAVLDGSTTTYSGSCSSSTGDYLITGLSYVDTDVITVHLNNAPGDEKAVAVVADPTSSDINDLDLYQNRVIVRHEGADPITISDMNAFDGGDDADIQFTASTGTPDTLTVDSQAELYVWPEMEFAPGGNITLQPGGSGDRWDGSLQLAASSTFSASGTESHSIGGSWFASSTATFNAAQSTVNFTATGQGKEIITQEEPFYNLTFNGAGGGWTFGSGNHYIDGDMNIITGSVTSTPGTLSAKGSWSNSGTFAHSSGTVTFTSTSSGKTIDAGSSPFYIVIFDGVSGGWQLSTSTLDIDNNLNITNGTLDAASQDINVAENLTLAAGGYFTKGTGTLTFDGSGINNWTDNNTTTQDIGNVAIDGSTKTLNLGSDVRATDITIGADDTLDVTVSNYDIYCAGSWTNNNIFQARNATVTMEAATQGETITASSSDFYNITFDGSGGWAWQDANATITQNFVVDSGTVTSTSGTLSIGGDFENNGGVFNHASGTVLLFSTSSQSISSNGSAFYNLTFDGTGGEWQFTAGNHDVDHDFTILQGTVTSTSGTLYVGGDWQNNNTFAANSGTVTFDADETGHTIDAGGDLFNIVTFDNSNGGWTVASDATSTGNWNLTAASQFTATSGIAIEVDGEFHNTLSSGNTTWSGATLFLNSGSNYTINTKATTTGDQYATLKIGQDTDIRMWNSLASTAYDIDSSASLYSMDHNQSDGSVYIFGDYHVSSGRTDYWSRTTDFDGADISGSARQCDVRVEAGEKVTVDGGILNIVGNSSATTTIDRQGASGSYSLEVDSGTLNANYYQIRNIDSDGLNLSGSAVISSLDYGDFLLQSNGGSMITVASTTLEQNAALTITGCKFSTSSGISSGYNVERSGNSAFAWTFTQHTGNYDGEDYDYDPTGECGNIRWDDSTCLLLEQIHYRWGNDDGTELLRGWERKRLISVYNSSSSELTNYPVQVKVGYNTDTGVDVNCGGNVQSDFDDIRFTNASETALLSHWRQDFSTNSTSSFWVKIPSLPANSTSTFYIYYDNSESESGSDGDNTFGYDGTGTSYSYLKSEADSFYWESRVSNTDLANGDDVCCNSTQTLAFDTHYWGDTGIDSLWVNSNGVTFLEPEPCNTDYDNNLTDFRNRKQAGFWDDLRTDVGGGGVSSPGVYLDSYSEKARITHENTRAGDTSDSVKSQLILFSSGKVIFSIGDSANFGDFTPTAGISKGDGSNYFDVTNDAAANKTWIFYLRKDISTEPSVTNVGSEGSGIGASWLVAEDTAASVSKEENLRVRFTINNTGNTIQDYNYRLQVAEKGAAPSCQAVATSSFVDVSTSSGLAVRMATSSYFVGCPTSSQATTTHQLSDVSGSTFVTGRMVEYSCNQTADHTLNQNQFTEVEYNVLFTTNATASAYCLRVTNAGSGLDSYSRVAEAQVYQPVSVEDVSLNGGQDIVLLEGSTTTVVATGTVSDANGYSDIASVIGKIYRSGVSGGSGCSTDENNCYQVSCATSSCAGDSCNVTCSFDVWFNADPTDGEIGQSNETPWSSEYWVAWIQGTDHQSTSGSATNTDQEIEVLSLLALEVTESIDYGDNMLPGDRNDPLDKSTNVRSTGNCSLDLNLYGNHMTAGLYYIPVSQQRYSTSSVGYSSAYSLTTSTDNELELNLGKTTSHSSPQNTDVWWGIEIPVPQPVGDYSGVNTFMGKKNEASSW